MHGSESTTNQDYLKQNQHGESLVIQSTIAVIAQEQDTPVTVQDRAPSHQSMHTVKGQQTKSQGQGHKAQTKRKHHTRDLGNSPGDQCMEPSTKQEELSETWKAGHNSVAATMQ